MGRRKEITLPLSSIGCYNLIIEELKKNPLLEDFDLEATILKLRQKKAKFRIKDVGTIILRLTQYIALNGEKTCNSEGYLIVSRKDLVNILKISPRTLATWLHERVVKKVRIVEYPLPCFELYSLLIQLKKHKESVK